MDDRPFWWVQETSIYKKGFRPVLRQTPLTCETGPGSPSGHVQGLSSVLYVVLKHVVDSYVIPNEKLSDCKKLTLKCIFWTLYMVLVVLVGMSRLYTATHFPHQTLLGFFAGIVTAILFVNQGRYTLTHYWHTASRPKMFLIGILMIGISFGAYWLQRLLGVDPQWSVRLAFKWCEHAEWIHVSTTPLFSLVRCCGSMFGLALSAPNATRVRNQPCHNLIIGALCTLSLLVAFQMASDAVPTSDVRLFYGCQFMLHAVCPFLLFIAIPRVARIVSFLETFFSIWMIIFIQYSAICATFYNWSLNVAVEEVYKYRHAARDFFMLLLIVQPKIFDALHLLNGHMLQQHDAHRRRYYRLTTMVLRGNKASRWTTIIPPGNILSKIGSSQFSCIFNVHLAGIGSQLQSIIHINVLFERLRFEELL
ncbi:hypothetical protein L9F63_010681, partial [Diploptera punctata]